MKRYIISICSLVFLLWGCSDFLEEQSQDLTYAVNCVDLEELLVGGAYANKTKANMELLHVMDDDVEEFVAGEAPSGKTLLKRLSGFHSYAQNPFKDEDGEYDDPLWPELYGYIGVTNAVLDKVDEFTGDLEVDRNRVKGQALFLRAYYYFQLVNLYAKPYSEITADEDLGVPLKTFAAIDDRYWSRASVKSVYDRIVTDLHEAVGLLAKTRAASSPAQ